MDRQTEGNQIPVLPHAKSRSDKHEITFDKNNLLAVK